MEEVKELLKQSGNQQQQQNGSNQETALDENVVAERVIETLSKKQAEEQMQNNWAQVEARVKEEFGSDATAINEKMKQIASENGMSVSDMKETARKSPKAFYRLAGLEGQQQTQRTQSPQPTHGSMQAPNNNNEKDLDYYHRLMRENWREYMKPHNQREYRKLLLEQNKN
jgi:preprotein translocase subunit SecD